jgi:hypothetical protein
LRGRAREKRGFAEKLFVFARVQRVPPLAIAGEVAREAGQPPLELWNRSRCLHTSRDPRTEVVEIRFENRAECDGVLLAPRAEDEPIGHNLER